MSDIGKSFLQKFRNLLLQFSEAYVGQKLTAFFAVFPAPCFYGFDNFWTDHYDTISKFRFAAIWFMVCSLGAIDEAAMACGALITAVGAIEIRIKFQFHRFSLFIRVNIAGPVHRGSGLTFSV